MKIENHPSGIKFSSPYIFNGSSSQNGLSQEEIDKLFEEMYKYDGVAPLLLDIECQHDWEEYIGIYTKNKTCKKCNKKEDL